MSDQKKYVRKGTWTARRVWANNDGLGGLNLGDLRALVAEAEGMPDKADVKFSDLKRAGEETWFARHVVVVHEDKQP